MPRKILLDSLKSESKTLETLIEEAKAVQDIIGENQFTYRLESINKQISEIESDSSPKANVALYFSGTPVIGSLGINAEFAGKSLEEFQNIISKRFAKYGYGDLGSRGRIPLREPAQLMVTEVTRGSFGFILEELSDQYEITDTSLKKIVEEVSNILHKSSDENETVFEEMISGLDPRTLLSVRDFFIHLDENKAKLKIVEDLNEYFFNETEIHRARLRTESTTIDDKEDVLVGIMLGLLPEHKKFELRLLDGQTILGDVDQSAIEEYNKLLFADEEIINKIWKISVVIREIKPLNRTPRKKYTLTQFVSRLS